VVNQIKSNLQTYASLILYYDIEFDFWKLKQASHKVSTSFSSITQREHDSSFEIFWVKTSSILNQLDIYQYLGMINSLS